MNTIDNLEASVQNSTQEREIVRVLTPTTARKFSKLQRTRRLQRNNAQELLFQTIYRWIDENHPTQDALNMLTSAHAELRHSLRSIG